MACSLLLTKPLRVKAAPVDSTVAKEMAWLFFRNLSEANRNSTVIPTVAYTAMVSRQDGTRNIEQPVYYIVNLGQSGFVIVSADDRALPILAYSTTSVFDGNQLPPNMASFLEEYQQQITQLCDNSEEPSPSVITAWNKVRHPLRNQTRDIVISPLLNSKWNQYPYYNALCPFEPRSANGHASAGCTAVAMGQIIRYWGYPTQGVGSKSYLCNYSSLGWNYGNYGLLHANFAATTYDYDHMPDSLTATSSQTEVDAIATLLYHCGVSISTIYGITSSSAVVSEVDDALRNYFDYDNPQHVFRDVYSELEWLTMIKNELNHLRPVFYTGAGTSSAHAFVCDGYDNQNFFHMNWGWGGYVDGYFLLSNLSPDVVSYNSAQTAIINIVVDAPELTVSKEELTFFENEGIPAEIQRVDVQTVNVTNNIHLSASGHFTVSLDSVNFYPQLDMPAEGGSFFVKYSCMQEVSCSELVKLVVSSGAAFDTVRLIGISYMPSCNAPLSMHGVQGDVDTDTNQVMLTWQPPLPDMVNFSWDSVPYGSVGSDEPYTVALVHRMEETDLLPYHKHLLTHVSFIALPQVTEYRVVVYKGGSLTNHGVTLNAGTKIVDQPVNLADLTMNEWNDIALATPLVIDASQELWYGILFAAPGHTDAIMYGNATCLPYKGNILGDVFQGETFWYPYDHNFILKATIDNPFIQYEVFRNGESLAVLTSDTSYADYPPVYAHYTYEVSANWNDQCGNGVSQEVNFRAPCHVVNQEERVYACDSFVWNEVTYTESGEYLHEYFNEDDCWQVDTLHLTLGHASAGTDNVVACDSLTWIDGITYYESTNTPTFTLTNSEQCDSVVTLNLIVVHSTYTTEEVTACDAYTWYDGVTYTESIQGPTVTFSDVIGCDNVTVTLDLTILHSSSYDDIVDACDSYTWKNNITYYESTNEPKLVYTNAVGCDSVVTLHLTIHNSTSSVDSIYSTTAYTWLDGNTYTESIEGPTVVLENAQGCDSVVTLYLTIADGMGSYQSENCLKVWPNPTNGQVRLMVSGMAPESDLEVRIYDVYGRLLQKPKLSTAVSMLDLSQYAPGVYILGIYNHNTLVGTSKIIKR